MADVDYLVVGAGCAGATAARVLADAGHRVLVIDQRDHVGGNAYDYVDEHGILCHKYGAHIFHTNSADVFEFLSRFTEWRPYEHRVLSNVDGRLLPVPINLTTLEAFGFDEGLAQRAMYDPYTRKQWGAHADHLLPSVRGRVAVRRSTDDRYFTDTYQAMPRAGYTSMFWRMLTHERIAVSLKTDYASLPASTVPTIYTGPIDQAFDHMLGRLPYRSAYFKHLLIPNEQRFQAAAVVNIPDPDVRWTRQIEFRQLTGQLHRHTVVAFEYPRDEGDPFWPVLTEASQQLYRQYAALAASAPWLHFCGRLGRFQYLNMDQAIAQALALTKKLLHQETPCTVQ